MDILSNLMNTKTSKLAVIQANPYKYLAHTIEGAAEETVNFCNTMARRINHVAYLCVSADRLDDACGTTARRTWRS